MANSSASSEWFPCDPEFDHSFTSYYLDGKHRDFMIECGNDTHKVHKIILCSQSEFFKKSCKSGFKESETNIFRLEDEDQFVVKVMVFFVYHLRWPTFTDKLDVNFRREDSLVLLAKVYAIADLLQIADLKVLTIARFKFALEKGWDSLNFIAALKELYHSERHDDNVLRHFAIQIAADYARPLLDKGDEDDTLTQILKANPTTAVDFIGMTVKMTPKEKSLACPKCYALLDIVQVASDSVPQTGYECIPCGKFYRYVVRGALERRTDAE